MSVLTTAEAVIALLMMLLIGIALGEPLQWQQKIGYRSAPLAVPTTGRAGFTLLTPEQTGVRFTNNLSYALAQASQNLLNGAGVAAGDFDGDGLCDLYFCNLQGSNGLFRNLGNGRFEDVTVHAGVACPNQASRGAVFADIDGDGKLDLLVSSLGGPNACFLNKGNGQFENVTAAAGLVLKAGGHSLALADVDGDGDLDLYLANYGEVSILRSGGTISVRTVNGKSVVSGRFASRLRIVNGNLIELGEPDVLYLNDGHGKFKPASWTDGTFLTQDGKPLKAAPWDLGLSAIFRDINGDGFPDLYVCNDFQTPDRIWINDGKGHFRALPDLALRTTCHFSMGIDFADIDRDGYDDIFVGDMFSRFHKLRMTQINATNPSPEIVGENMDRKQVRRNTLSLNRGDGTYAEIANFANVDASDWSWAVAFLDVDLDGFEDLLIANGHAYDTQDLDVYEKNPEDRIAALPMKRGKQLKDYPPLITPNVLFRNRGDRTFAEVGESWGFSSTNVSHGISLADLDNDGDLDVIVSCLWQAPLIYRNESSAPRVAIRLKGKAPNTQGIGAKIRISGGAVPLQTQEIVSGGRYLSADDPMRVFAAGSLTNRLRIEVAWRSGLQSVIDDALPNQIYELDETSIESRNQPAGFLSPREKAGVRGGLLSLFEDATGLISHVHHDVPFNDFERQPLLPRMFSQSGPGVSWFDLDGDGHDDLLIPNGKGGSFSVYKNDGTGGFTAWPDAPWKEAASDDQTTALGWVTAPESRGVLVAVSKYEAADPQKIISIQSADLLHNAFKPATITASLPSPGPMALADIDGDGDLDLFVGGRIVPGRYPEPASSLIFKNNGGQLELDEANSLQLRNVGLVSGAVFSDLTGDGSSELILACEWGPIRVFTWTDGKLRELTETLGLANFTGWWNGVTTGDFDGDGKLDIVASNWGLNSSYHNPTATQPVRTFFGDLDDNGTVDLIETEIDALNGHVVPYRDLIVLSTAMPLIRERFPTHGAFSVADVNAIIGNRTNRVQQLKANTLATMVFLNRGDHFEAAPTPLPDEAQFSPAFGVNVADFDGDGSEDIFLSQNFFGVRLYEHRQDAGRGLLLRGNGKGRFSAVPGQESGIKIYGEQRGSAVCDYDEDGRSDLVVAQNSAETKLYHNVNAKPGLRIKLAGPAANPQGVGALIRLKSGVGFGPAREIHAGSGYWSQDSAVQVMTLHEPPAQIEIRWPGGKTTMSDFPSAAKEIVVSFDGTATKTR
jgi:enediyne biosynthesis protein E4